MPLALPLTKDAALKRIRKELRDARADPRYGTVQYGILRIGPVVPLGREEEDPEVDWMHWHAVLAGPPGTPYEGGRFLVNIRFPTDYPFKPPRNQFITRVYNMNISPNGSHCLSIDMDDWSPALTVVKLCLSLHLLLALDPNPDAPMVPGIAHQYLRDRASYEAECRRWTRRHARHLDRWRFWAQVVGKLVLCYKRTRGIRPGGARALEAQAEFEALQLGADSVMLE